MSGALEHVLTVGEALDVLADIETDIASNSYNGRSKRLTYRPATSQWRAYLGKELLVESTQPYHAVNAYSEAR